MKRDGFTLIELAIVLTIVGVIIGGSFKLLKSSRQKAYINEAKEQVAIAKDAIIGDALEYGNLSTVANFDQNLSPAKGNVNDHNKSFFYLPDTNLSKPDSDICAFNSTGLQVDVMNDTTLDHTIYDVAFVVAAQSANRNLQTGYSTSGGITTVKVYRPSDKADDNSNDFTRNFDEFDDVVGWVTLDELQSQVKCNEKPFRFLNDRLPHAKVGQTYGATLYVENNVTNASITCTTSNDHNITTYPSGSSFDFNGTAPTAGTALFNCTSQETAPGYRTISKSYVITVDP